MPEKIRRVRRKRRIRPFPGAEFFPSFRPQISPTRLALLIGAAAFGVVLAVILYSYGSKAFGRWREGQLLRRASTQLAKDDFTGATRSAEKALELDHDSLPAFQILAEATEKQNRIETVAWRAQIARRLPQHLDSQLNLASAALRFGELDVARKALENVSPGDRDKAAYHVVAGWLARAQGDEAGLQQHFAEAVKKEPGNDLYQFNLAALQIKSPETEKKDNARVILDRLSKVPQFRAGALRALLTDAIERNDRATADGLAQDLQMSQQVTFSDYLLCLNFYRKLDEKKFAAVLDKVKPVAARNPDDLAALMDWMNSNGMAADVLKWMEKLPVKLTNTPPAAISIGESFADAKNWSRLKRWTRSGSWGKEDYLRLAYQAYAAKQSRQTGTDAEFDSLWRSAERAANDQPEAELSLARLSTKWNLHSEAQQLWLRVAKNAPMRREALDALVRIYRANNDLPNLYRTTQRLHETSPGDLAAAANYARLALLLDQNAEEGHRVAKDVYDHAPTDVNCAVTYAFSLYGLGRTGEGIEILKRIPREQLHDPHAAVFAAVLLLDENLPGAAKEFVEAAHHGQIYTEEKKLLEEAVGKSAVSPSPSPTPTPSPIGGKAQSPAKPTPAPPAKPAERSPATKPSASPAATPPVASTPGKPIALPVATPALWGSPHIATSPTPPPTE